MPNKNILKPEVPEATIFVVNDLKQIRLDLTTIVDVAVHGTLDGRKIVSTLPFEAREQIAVEIMKYLDAYKIKPKVLMFETGVPGGEAIELLRKTKRLVQ